jgi:glutathione S-transferase
MAITVYIPAYASVPTIQCSPPSWMALIALEEKGATYRVEELSFSKGEHKSPAMLARNPRGSVPVLQDGAHAVHETFAILAYIEACVPGPPLLPTERGAQARALTRFFETAYVKDTGMALLQHMMRSGDEERQRELVDAFQAELDHWERYYGASSFCAGEALSLADIVVFSYVATAERLLGGLLDGRAALPRFSDAMRMRASVRATWPDTWPPLHSKPSASISSSS